MKPSKTDSGAGRPSAASRTIDLFAERTEPTPEDIQKIQPKESETIEQAAERWRANAIFTAEHFSKHFNDGLPNDEVFRITTKDGWLFLEKFSHDKSGKAYHWTGLMFREDNLYELTNVFVKASKDKQLKGFLGHG